MLDGEQDARVQVEGTGLTQSLGAPERKKSLAPL